ncbi:hypothetical protein D9758_011619 [Tetrapyrgos nigripes]|uniref:NodB homology domain-containing protein n=1 Tax=Tetrapyrgos nigripes TaxID=182062 RepID=A0A8H5FS27_9AGAR|nr:hypothetical protein D9758_011619 [Tetrapyrgos nigripes]
MRQYITSNFKQKAEMIGNRRAPGETLVRHWRVALSMMLVSTCTQTMVSLAGTGIVATERPETASLLHPSLTSIPNILSIPFSTSFVFFIFLSSTLYSLYPCSFSLVYLSRSLAVHSIFRSPSHSHPLRIFMSPSTTVLFASLFGLSTSLLTGAFPVESRSPLAEVITSCTVNGTAALTFDDGPYLYTKKNVDQLDAAGAVGTWFFNGDNYDCIYNQDAVDRVKYVFDHGHQVASHTWAHANLTTLNKAAITSEFSRTQEAIWKITGAKVAFTRPPYGETNDDVLAVASQQDQNVINWDLDSNDWRGNVNASKGYYDETIAKKPSTILTLNHDTLQPTSDEIIPCAIQALQKAGYKLVSVADCLGVPAYLDFGSAQSRDVADNLSVPVSTVRVICLFNSFYKSTVMKSDGSYEVVSTSLDTDSSPYIAVPSRIYTLSKNTSELPLARLRISVKDLYYMKGIITSAGNRAFYATYPARNTTAPAITRLTDAGAHIIGATKMVQFANGDRATADWVDYHAPFSSRGDENVEPSGSSTGATSIATLDWLDASLGSDTGGSVRSPGAVNVLLLSTVLDTAGYVCSHHYYTIMPQLMPVFYLTRSPKLFASFDKVWYAESFQSYPAFPMKLLVSDEFSLVSDEANDIYNPWIEKLRTFLDGEVVVLSSITNGLTSVYLCLRITLPKTEDAVRISTRRSEIDRALVSSKEQMGMQLKWRRERCLDLDSFLENTESCTKNLFLYPHVFHRLHWHYLHTHIKRKGSIRGHIVAEKRIIPLPPNLPFGFRNIRIASLARSVEIVIPIGQIPYQSNISEIEEQLSVSISLVGRRGCDFDVDKLADEGIVQEVKTGRTAF